MSSAFPSLIPLLEYPESDGLPMGETDIHIAELAALLDTLKDRYRLNPDVYVAGNNIIYYEEGVPASRFSPDVYVVLGVPKRERRTYKLWEEKHPPTTVFEFTSRQTKVEDKGNKKALCAELGVAEYFLCDPEGEYLRPSLQGFRLKGGEYHPISPSADGSIESRKLGLRLRQEDRHLLLWDSATGQRVLRPEEVRDAHRQDAAEIERLRAELARLKRGGKSHD